MTNNDRRSGKDRLSTCLTCDAVFVMTHHSQKYCSLDHNPVVLSMDEKRALIKLYGPRVHLYK